MCFCLRAVRHLFIKESAPRLIIGIYLPSTRKSIDPSIVLKHSENKRSKTKKCPIAQKLFVDYSLTIVSYVVCVLVIGYGKYFSFCTITIQPQIE